jgi:hypothetical protein
MLNLPQRPQRSQSFSRKFPGELGELGELGGDRCGLLILDQQVLF